MNNNDSKNIQQRQRTRRQHAADNSKQAAFSAFSSSCSSRRSNLPWSCATALLIFLASATTTTRTCSLFVVVDAFLMTPPFSQHINGRRSGIQSIRSRISSYTPLLSPLPFASSALFVLKKESESASTPPAAANWQLGGQGRPYIYVSQADIFCNQYTQIDNWEKEPRNSRPFFSSTLWHSFPFLLIFVYIFGCLFLLSHFVSFPSYLRLSVFASYLRLSVFASCPFSHFECKNINLFSCSFRSFLLSQ